MTGQGPRRLLQGASLLALVGLLGGCAGSQRAPAKVAEPASPAAGRAEIDRLGQAITGYRAELGLSPHDTDDAATGEQKLQLPQDGAAQRAGEPQSDSLSQPEPPAEQPSVPRCSPVPQTESEEVMAAEKSCPRPCQITRAICMAAQRICHIAGYLADADAWQRCQRAKADCEEARQVTEGQCEACDD